MAIAAFLTGLFAALQPAGARELLCSLPSSITPGEQTGWQPYPGLSVGKLFVATRQLEGPIFQQSVILLINYDQTGTMGLIINRPSEMLLSKLFPKIKGLEKRKDTAFFGGPVQMDQMFLLISAKKQPSNSFKVLDGVYASIEIGTFKRLAVRPDAKFRLYVGYAGWAPGQLESELAKGSWYVRETDAGTVFGKSPENLWPALIKKSGIEAQR